jgi:hypothetical protein
VSAGDIIRVRRRDGLGGLIHEYSQVARSENILGTHTPAPTVLRGDARSSASLAMSCSVSPTLRSRDGNE